MDHAPTNSMRTKHSPYSHAVALAFVAMVGLAGQTIRTADAGEVVYLFEAEMRSEGHHNIYGIPMGLQISGSYTFELNTPGSTPSNDDDWTSYSDAVTGFTVTVPGFGAGHGSGGLIFIGAPVRTQGSYNYLSHKYYVLLDFASGITISVPDGDMHLSDASIALKDIDMDALDSEDLSATPPNLEYFTDTSGPTSDTTDEAKIFLTFDYPTGGTRSIPFELTALVAVPEPGIGCLIVIAATMFLGCRPIRSTRSP